MKNIFQVTFNIIRIKIPSSGSFTRDYKGGWIQIERDVDPHPDE